MPSTRGPLYTHGATGLSLETEAGEEAVLRKMSTKETVQKKESLERLKSLSEVSRTPRDRGYVEIAADAAGKTTPPLYRSKISIVRVVGETRSNHPVPEPVLQVLHRDDR